MAVFDKSDLTQALLRLKGILAPKSVAFSVTAPASGWSNAQLPSQTITVNGVTSGSNIVVGSGSLTVQQRKEMLKAQIMCTGQGANNITLTVYGKKPTVDLPITIFLLG